MVYEPSEPTDTLQTVTPEKFRAYGVPVQTRIADRPDVVAVVPESMTEHVWRYRAAQVVVWWLSVDGYLAARRPARWTRRAKLWLRGLLPSRRSYDFQPRPNVHHAWQSEYARQFLVRRGVSGSLPLTDYLAAELLPAPHELKIADRQDQILYNPVKGKAFTDALREACTADPIEFVALKGFSAQQMRQILCSAKVYIDFGGHPGRDRIPREAAACGCVVITGRQGSAANDLDVPLPLAYKLDDRAPDAIAKARELLLDVIARTPGHVAAQQDYRETIRRQQAAFEGEAADLGRFFANRTLRA